NLLWLLIFLRLRLRILRRLLRRFRLGSWVACLRLTVLERRRPQIATLGGGGSHGLIHLRFADFGDAAQLMSFSLFAGGYTDALASVLRLLRFLVKELRAFAVALHLRKISHVV